MTTRGMKAAEMEQIAGFIDRALKRVGDEAALREIAAEVEGLCKKFPVYPYRLPK